MGNDIQYYDENLQQLQHPWKHKIKKIIEHKCIEKIDDNFFVCNPISGYNVTTYKMRKLITSDDFTCTCQGFKKRNDCSHHQALLFALGRIEL